MLEGFGQLGYNLTPGAYVLQNRDIALKDKVSVSSGAAGARF